MFGKTIKVNLTTREVFQEQIPAEWVDDYIGGSGLGARLLWEALDPALDALDPASPMVWVTGPLTGTNSPTSGRSSICARSPQTGLWGESNIGGFAGVELRKAGIDVLWISGKADSPLYLLIKDGRIDFKPAEHLWGSADTYETQDSIVEETGIAGLKVASIGKAGENLIPFACIISDHGRAAGRTGMGAVMGSKNLKAIAIKGSKAVEMKDPKSFKALAKQSNQKLLDQNITAIFNALGTSGAVDYLELIGDMPQKYWTEAQFEGAGKISGAEMAATILTGTRACFGCVIACGREVHIKEGPYQTEAESKGPEYETICALGSQLMVDDLALITKLGDTCDRLGLDTISAGNILALAYLLFERGLLSENETDGITLRWGEAIECIRLLEKSAQREGFGAELAEGSKALAARYGAEELAVEVNGMEVPMHDPRAYSGQALSYLTSPRGACHNQSDFFNVEMGGTIEEVGVELPERWEDSGKAQYVAKHQFWRSVCNSLATCFFAVVSPQEYGELLSAAIGGDWSIERMMACGERAWNLKRLINIKLGYTPENEVLPKLLREALPDGGQEGHTPNVGVLLDEYYKECGWNRRTGVPSHEKLLELGIQDLL